MKINDRMLIRGLSVLAVVYALCLPGPIVAQGPAPVALSPFAVRKPDAKTPSLGIGPVTKQDTLTCWACNREKNIWYAIGESAVGLWVPWSFNAFVRGAEFAWVNPMTWHDGIFGAWIWDDNSFVVNQIGHPYQGSLYYSGFRNNGYGFYTSSLAAGVGSFIWECCGETHPASPNDQISTWLGGISLGEFGRRLGDIILDNRTTGVERVSREVVGGIVNPIRLLDRLVRGEAWRLGANDPSTRPNWLQGSADLGYINITTKQETKDTTFSGAVLRLGLVYGEPISSIPKKPFSHFQLAADLTTIPHAYLLGVRSRGSIWGKPLAQEGKHTALLATFLNYDYSKNPAFEFGAQSFTGGFMGALRPNAKTNLYYDVLARGVALGAIETDFYEVTGEGRNYDFGMGGGMGVELAILRRGLGTLRGQYNYVGLRTLNGAASSHILQAGEVTARYELGGKYGIGGTFKSAWRHSFYGDGRRTEAHAPEFRIFVASGLPRWTY